MDPAPTEKHAPVIERPTPVTPPFAVIEAQAGDIAVAPVEPAATTPVESIGPAPVLTGVASALRRRPATALSDPGVARGA